MRERLFPEAPRPTFTGQGVYRIVCERPPELNGSRFFPKGDTLLGCSLVSPTHMYLFLLLPMPGNPRLPIEAQPQHLYEKLAGWGGFVAAIREQVRSSPVRETINYRPLEALLLNSPWYRGRVLLIGDAAHATTPHLASISVAALRSLSRSGGKLAGIGRNGDARRSARSAQSAHARNHSNHHA
jgi:2-polyprenyl-6-methoxyphenol hydroxylase-like FAD-dependent oxidoreductase